MRHLLMKEAADLAPVGLVAAAAGALIAGGVARNDSFPTPGLTLLCVGLGAAVGVTQGILDRSRRDDPFLLHRPEPAEAIHAMRGAAGALWTAAVAALAMSVAAIVPPGFAPYINASVSPEIAPDSIRIDPGFTGALVAVAGALVFHAVARLALTPRGWIASATLLVALPVMVLYLLLSHESQSAPWLLFAAVFAIATALADLNLARRPA
ncbi:MAG: hypothetical protein K8T90_04450 [Planctomycetes bacterium]|nr:hypothetical protein [Planctomycetota bacterium]